MWIAVTFSVVLGGALWRCLAADPAVDPRWQRKKPPTAIERLLALSRPAPATRPTTTRAVDPFTPRAGSRRRDAIPGVVTLSDGRELPGRIYTTRDKPLRIFSRKRQAFVDVPMAAVRRLDAVVEWEKDQRDWRWKEGGMDVKVYTGKTYPARQLYYRLTLANGEVLAGDIAQPLYVELAGHPQRVILHKRQKGPLDTTLAELRYVQQVEFSREAMQRSIDRLAAASQPAASRPAP